MSRFMDVLGRMLRRRRSPRPEVQYHKARIEVLEPRLALAVSLAPLADATLLAGAPLSVAVHATDPSGEISEYRVTSSNPDIAPTLLDPYENRSLRIAVRYTGKPNDHKDDFSGEMVFQLFENWASNATWQIATLADSGGPDYTPFYDGLTFHRVIQDVMIQGGDPKGNGTGGSGTKFDDEFSPELQFTSSGILAMANGGPDTNDSQFFITSAPYRSGDFRYTIVGYLTSGDEIRQKIAAVPVNSNNKPLYPVRITSAGTDTNELDRVLHLSAPAGTTGTSTITVEAWGDGPTSGTQQILASRSFSVTIQDDTNNNRPYLDRTGLIADPQGSTGDFIETVAGVPITFQIKAMDVENDPIHYAGTVDPSSKDITLAVNSSTGRATLAPLAGAVGVRAVALRVRKPIADPGDSNAWDTHLVPVYIRPAGPAVALAPESDTGLSNTDGVTKLNNTAGKKLRFIVNGTISGATVEVLADGVVIGAATASGTSMTIESDGIRRLANGPHTITVRQTLKDQEVHVGNLEDTTDLTSDESSPFSITVDTAGLWITTFDLPAAIESEPYSYQVTTNDPGSEARFALTTAPTGMTIHATTGLISWAPGEIGGSTNPVTIQMTDLAGNVTSQSFSLLVQRANRRPVANGQSVTTAEGAAASITLTGDDGDAGVTQALSFAIASGPSHGVLSGFNPATGKVTYTPAADFAGSDSFTFTVTDDDTAGLPATLTSAAATVSIQVQPVNRPPVANAQSVTTAEGTATDIRLSGDDGDPGTLQTLIFAIASGPSHGVLSGFDPATGKVTYTPAADYAGSDSFTFTVTDDNTAGSPATLTSAAATVSIQVQPVNRPPVAHAQSVTTTEGTATDIRLSGDDSDPGTLQTLIFAIVSGPSHGVLSGFDPATGKVTYTPVADYAGSDSFTFTVTDDATAGLPATLTSAAATVSIQVQPVNRPPVAHAQSVTTAEGTATDIRLSGDDGDPGTLQTLIFAIVNGPSHGVLSGFDPATGKVTYTPAADYAGSDSFTFTVTDDATAGLPATLTSAAATVSIQIQPVNRPPVANAQSVTTAEGTATNIRLSGDDGDPGTLQTLIFAIASGPSHGVLSGFDPAAGTLTYTPAADYAGSDSFTFTVTDDGTAGFPATLTSAAATVSIQVQPFNRPPMANAQSVTTAEGTATNIRLSGDDGDPGTLQTLIFAIVSGPSHGVLSGFDPATGAVTYTPTADYAGSDSFTFTVTDDDTAGLPGTLTSAAATVSIQVQPVNRPPVVNAQSITTAEGTATDIRLSGDDGDPGTLQTLIFAIANGPSHGVLSGFNPATGTVTYTPTADYAGSDSFTFTVTDDDTAGLPATLTSAAATVSIQVQPVNRPPVADAQSVTTAEGMATDIRLIGDDGDPGTLQTLIFAIASGPSHGVLSGFDLATGAVTYTPAADYAGSDSFTFTVTDDDTAGLPATLTSSAATVSIQVQPVNRPPMADAQSVTTAEGMATDIRLIGDDGDPGTLQTLIFAIASGPSHGVLSGFNPATGTVTYTPAADYAGSDSFTFTVTDDDTAGLPATLTSAAVTVSIQVQPVNRPPVAEPHSVTTAEGTATDIRLTGDDGDPGALQTLIFAIVSGPSHGVLSGFDPVAGTVTYTPAADYAGSDSFTFTVTDDDSAGLPATLTSAAATVSIQVQLVNRPPVADGQDDTTAKAAGTNDSNDVSIISPVNENPQPIDPPVQNTGTPAAADPPSSPSGVSGRNAIWSLSQVFAFANVGPHLRPALGAVPGLGRLLPPSSQSFVSPPVGFEPITGSRACHLSGSSTLGESDIGGDTGFRGGMTVVPESSQDGDPGESAGKTRSGAGESEPRSGQERSPTPGSKKQHSGKRDPEDRVARQDERAGRPGERGSADPQPGE